MGTNCRAFEAARAMAAGIKARSHAGVGTALFTYPPRPRRSPTPGRCDIRLAELGGGLFDGKIRVRAARSSIPRNSSAC
jgi:hypothetical protein